MYKLDKFSDMDIVTLEELEEDDEEPAKIKWKKIYWHRRKRNFFCVTCKRRKESESRGKAGESR